MIWDICIAILTIYIPWKITIYNIKVQHKSCVKFAIGFYGYLSLPRDPGSVGSGLNTYRSPSLLVILYDWWIWQDIPIHYTVDENIIATSEMWFFFYPLKMVIFPILQ